jgi:hypothetical protein
MKSKIKKIRFNEFLLIRNIDSIIDFKKDLWWNEFDYYFFQKSATQEINAIMYKNKSIIRKDAIRLLYQPNDVVIYDEPKCIII